jgi:hypothetical protein
MAGEVPIAPAAPPFPWAAQLLPGRTRASGAHPQPDLACRVTGALHPWRAGTSPWAKLPARRPSDRLVMPAQIQFSKRDAASVERGRASNGG